MIGADDDERTYQAWWRSATDIADRQLDLFCHLSVGANLAGIRIDVRLLSAWGSAIFWFNAWLNVLIVNTLISMYCSVNSRVKRQLLSALPAVAVAHLEAWESVA